MKFSEIKGSRLFTSLLPADSYKENSPRQVNESAFSIVYTNIPSKPEMIHFSTDLLSKLDIEIDDTDYFTKVMSGSKIVEGNVPYAMCYGGHQFGHWAGQLGDGRAITVAEIERNGFNWEFQLKGSGPTPYSRKGDGYAVLRSSIREYLCSEAMHHLGIPTTRALSLVKTGDLVLRDMLYDGNPANEQGAIVCRVSESFLRFGSYEIFASRKDTQTLKMLVDYTINQHYPELGTPAKETYIAFFKEVAKRTKDLMIHWQRVGFVHGVMNTDNMSILGQTIDYGPYGWLENFDLNWTPNTTDAQHKRYRFGNQPSIALWNLLQLANALYPLIEEAKPLEDILKGYERQYQASYHQMMLSKLGLSDANTYPAIISECTALMEKSNVDMTIFFRLISSEGMDSFPEFWKWVKESSYLELAILEEHKGFWKEWFDHYDKCIRGEGRSEKERVEEMKKVNPKYVLRNYMAQLAIDDAEKGNYALIDELYVLLLNPYDEQPDKEKWFAKRPSWAEGKVGCGMLSCSS